MRTNEWLEGQLKKFLDGPFADVEIVNKLMVQFGRKAKRRFGSIKMPRDKKISRIVINGLFRDEKIPVRIINATIAHELCHYMHGFSSPLKQKYRHPHQGGVIAKELKKRGLHSLYKFEKTWTKENWSKIVLKEFPQTRRRIVRRVRRRRPSLFKIAIDLIKP